MIRRKSGVGVVRAARGWAAAVVTAMAVGLVVAAGLLGGCGGASTSAGQAAPLLADNTFMADIVRNVAGDVLPVASLLPQGADPHAFEARPKDARRVAESRAVIINIPGFEPAIDQLIAGTGKKGPQVIEAGAGIAGVNDDPHVWMDPLAVITCVDNIRAGLTLLDPSAAEVFARNAQAYDAKLRELDQWIVSQVATIPAPRRLLVTNHESLGHFAERYGFRVVGTVYPTVSGDGSPSAKGLAELVKQMRATGAPAVFLEAGSISDVADELAKETGVRVVSDLYVHSTGKGATTYVDMMRWDVNLIVGALR